MDEDERINKVGESLGGGGREERHSKLVSFEDGQLEELTSQRSGSSDGLVELVKISVKDHWVIQQGSSYEDYFWTLFIKIDSLAYTVDRSYVDFVDLDRRIRKKYPRLYFSLLPFDEGVMKSHYPTLFHISAWPHGSAHCLLLE